ncbi:copper resistance protein CopD [Virgibacillus phasianinus]|uniref:Copper resistance protein CopD n=1 Tax=Virgibacillus phasianinus TaxID=2017483 RepID=A0A220TZS4_9BACI|nr:copper resistance protein CopD [Virgibacillus phasianinus]ASK61327.1 copper resistance protein CopD [Virgibacillus phasianinus]
MTLFVSLTEFILYCCFSILIGSLILLLVPENKRPSLYIPKKILYLATGLIPLTSLLPVASTAKILSGDWGFWFIFKNVLFTFEIGKSWLFIAIISAILIRVLIAKELETNKHLIGLALSLSIFMLLGYTKSSHAATITEWQGFLFHTLHFLAVTVWIGLLLIVSWFSKNKKNWLTFLRWFTPVAMTCLIITFIAGYFTMSIDINSYDDPNASVLQEYKNSLIVNYGQALVIKHILIVSLVLFAIINGILFRKRNLQDSFNPLKWARLEGIYALIVFGVTAFMGQSWPPHQVYNLIKTEGTSPLFRTIYGGDILSTYQSDVFNITVSFGYESYLLFLLSLLFMIITVFAATKRQSVFASILSSLLMILAAYIGLMIGIQ